MKVLVTGSSGLLGRQVWAALKESSQLVVVGTCYTRKHDGMQNVDLTDDKCLESLFNSEKVCASCQWILPKRAGFLVKVMDLAARGGSSLCRRKKT